jgi:DNA-binding Xre family transcriptional regulator
MCITPYGDYIPLIFKIITPIIGSVKYGGYDMIIFDRLWETMAKKGITTYQLREKCGIDSKTIRRLRANDNMETKTLNKLCAVLECRLEDIAEYVED